MSCIYFERTPLQLHVLKNACDVSDIFLGTKSHLYCVEVNRV